MAMFITSQKINNEGSKEYKSIQLAQKYMEEIKAMDTFDNYTTLGYTRTDDGGGYKYTKIIPGSTNDYGATIEIESGKDVDAGADTPVDFDATMTIETALVKYLIKDEAVPYSYSISGDIDIVINNTGLKIQGNEIISPLQKKIKVVLNKDAKINISNNLTDEVELFIFNLDSEKLYNCTVNVEKGEVKKINNNSIVPIEKTAKNILYNIKIEVKKGTESINTIEGTTIFKYKPK